MLSIFSGLILEVEHLDGLGGPRLHDTLSKVARLILQVLVQVPARLLVLQTKQVRDYSF